VTGFGSAAFAGTLAALLGSFPAALRVAPAADANFALTSVWLALTASSMIFVIALVLVLRGTRRGLLSFGGEGAVLRALGLVLWLVGSTDLLLIFGAALRATTHHHALAGATFACIGLGILVLSALVMRRLVALAGRLPPGLGPVLFAGALALSAFFLLYFSVKASSPVSRGVPLFLDVLAYLIAGGFASRDSFVRKPLALIGPPLAVIILVLGVAPLRAPSVRTAVDVNAPLLAGPVDLTSRLVLSR
jgi:hypothetical protein